MIGTLGGPELLLILVIALIVFGPRKLPEIGKSIGKMLVEFRKATSDFKRTIEDEVEADKLRAALDEVRNLKEQLQTSSPAAAPPPALPGEASAPAPLAPEIHEVPVVPTPQPVAEAVSRDVPSVEPRS
jgi:Tat protein translocase TatB subunit